MTTVSRKIQHLHQRSRSRHVLQSRRDGRKRSVEIRRNAEIELSGVVPIGFVIQRREVPPVGILDEFDALVALGGTPFVAEKLLDGLGLGRAANDQYRVGLVAGQYEVI